LGSDRAGEHERHLVDRRNVLGGDDRLLVDVAEERNLPFDLGVEEPVSAAEEDVRLDANRSQVAHAVLRRLGLQLAGRPADRSADAGGAVAGTALVEVLFM
jgi:antitoxin component of RelBE/YafQ-DinJ toxin-antitoxin module